MPLHRIHNNCGQVALWLKFPDLHYPMNMHTAQVASIATLLREKGKMTKEVAQGWMSVVVAWAGLKITLEYRRDQPLVIGKNGGVHVVLRVCAGAQFNEFNIRSSTGLVKAPPLAHGDPVCSVSLLRAISGGLSLTDFELPPTVFAEGNREFTMPLSAAAKPDALAIAQSIWSTVQSNLPGIKLADHTELDAMGSLNLGTMFKVTSLLLAQGALSKYILCVIHEFQFVFLSGQNVVYVGSGIGKTAWLLSVLAQLDLNVFAFERDTRNHDFSAQALLQVRSHPKVHNLKVAFTCLFSAQIHLVGGAQSGGYQRNEKRAWCVWVRPLHGPSQWWSYPERQV